MKRRLSHHHAASALRRTPYTLAAAACLAAAATGALSAQEQPQRRWEKLMPAATANTLLRLSELNRIDVSEWRTHAGDLPHGESVSLDDTSWKTAKAGSEAPADAVWYRRWIEIPKSVHGYDPAGARLSFRFVFYADDDVPEILYFDGRRVAMGPDLEPVVLTENAKPGDRFLVAVKLLPTATPKKFASATLSMEFADSRPSPSDFITEAVSAETLIPTLSKEPAADKAIVEKAVAAVDLAALDSNSADAKQRFDASLVAAQRQLEALKPMLQQATFWETGNSHIDAAWLWPVTETVDAVHRTFGTAAQLLDEYPKYTYTQSAAQYNEWIAQKYPDLNKLIKKDIQAGRWEVLGGMWVEPDLNLPDGESLTRSILLGKLFFQKEYGVDVHIGWNPDSFGYNWQLPQIYSKSGIDTFVTQKMAWSDTNKLPFKLFWWEAPDGSKVLTYFPHDYANDSIDPLRLSADLAVARKQAPGLTTMMDLYGIGDHGGGPTRAMLDEGMHWADSNKVIPNMEFGTADKYFAQVRPKVVANGKTWNYDSIAQGYTYPAEPAEGTVNIPTWNDELYLEYHRGVFTTQAAHKRNMRTSEVEALNAEKYASLAWLGGRPYPTDEFNDAWKKITFNDFHDLAAGSGIGVIYRDAQAEFDVVRRETNEISDASLSLLAAGVNTKHGAGVPVLVWNSLAWQRSGPVMVDVQLPEPASEVSVVDEKGHTLASQVLSSDAKTNSYKLLVQVEDVPSLGYTLLHVTTSKKSFPSTLKTDGLTLENDAVRVVVDKQTGCITSLYDKKNNFETIAANGCANELQAFKDNPKKYDAWNIDPGTLDAPPTKLDTADSVELVEHTPMRGVIRIHRKWQSSTFTQEVALATGEDHVIVSTDVDWRERHILLKAAFPLAASSTHATYEIPYGSIERPTTRNNSWDKARFEVPALRWADEGDGQHGFSLLNDSKYGYDGAGNVLRLSLLRSPTSPDAEADQGMQLFRYALYPHGGDWKQAGTVRHGYEFNYPLTAMQVASHEGALPATYSYAAVSSPSVIVTALKKAEDTNSLVLRMYESAGKGDQVTVTLPPGAAAAHITNLMEKQQGAALPLAGNTVQVPIHPWEILTLEINYTP